MAEMRWLLDISINPEQEHTPAEFEIWLRNLDGELRPPICVTTVDELLTVLLAAWHQRRTVFPPPA